MSVDIASKDISKISDEQRRIVGCLVGTYPGVQSQTPSEEDIKGINNNTFNKRTSTMAEYMEAVYDAAMVRDLKYCVYNRKAMRVNGAADKVLACSARGKSLGIINELK